MRRESRAVTVPFLSRECAVELLNSVPALSLEKYRTMSPILMSDDGYLIDGFHRAAGLRLASVESVMVLVVVAETEEEEDLIGEASEGSPEAIDELLGDWL